MSDRGRFGHKVSAYERPNQPFLCGRSGMWKKSCWQGPGPGGQCGGMAECSPARIGDRWECKRPKRAGGTCAEGPLPDGTCGNCRAPCAPRRNLRNVRGHIAVLAALALFVLLIVGIDPRANSVVGTTALDAGNLTSVHSGFTREQGCSSCHEGHQKEAGGWLLAAFKSNDPSAGCVSCHDFTGPVMKAHNREDAKKPEAGGVSCASCHTEHKGAGAKIAQVPDFACANCHQKSFDSFVGGHPAFPANYPYTRPGTIYFDHAKHLKDYFTDPKRTKGADRDAKFAAVAKSKCTACHSIEGATREVKPKPYAQICAGCHDGQIAKRELVLLEPEKVTAAASILLGMEKEGDAEAAKQRLTKLWSAMARSGVDPIAEVAPKPEASAKLSADALYAGLSGQVAREAGTAWSTGRALAATGAKADAAGWATGENADGNASLFYRPTGHADPVLKAWIETLRVGLQDKDSTKRSLAKEAMNDFLDSQTGPGACGKCHSAALRSTEPGKTSASWGYTGPDSRPLTRYTHTKHLGLVDPDAGCTTCHELNPAAKYPKYFTAKASAKAVYESNFSGIRKETCVECHREGQVNSACQDCHVYHLPHRFNLGFRQKGGITK
jgi:predicted CXXCH cytochrome family protein